MKNFRRSVRRFIPAIIFSVIFTLLFPYSLMAQSSEQKVAENKSAEYKIPENSMSYLAQAQTVNQPTKDTAQTAATLSNSDRLELEPEFAQQTQAPANIQIVPEPATTTPRQHHKIIVASAAPQQNAHKKPA
ncbi:MAG: MSCRAMM family adhesin SdrC, partial [Candidatus Riflebacteria bacterium]|nr:MSCRAMM family adhesin SdrC [Candidatus Riflebacteria bacterium]